MEHTIHRGNNNNHNSALAKCQQTNGKREIITTGFPHFPPEKIPRLFPDFSSISVIFPDFYFVFPDTHFSFFFFKYGLHLLLGNCIINTTVYTKLCLLQYLAVKPPLIAIQRPLYCL